MVKHDNNLFQQYTPKENKHFQSELQSNGKAKAHLNAPDYMGKGIQDYKKKPKHHMSRKLSAILISIGVVIIALVVVGATASYHRDAPSTTSPNAVQQAPKSHNQSRKATKTSKQKSVHKKSKVTHKHTKPRDNVIQVTNNQAKVEPKKTTTTKESKSKHSAVKPVKPDNIKKTISSHSESNTSSTDKSLQKSQNQNNQSQKTSTKSQP